MRVCWPHRCALVAYAALTGLAIWHHEPWADEAHSWLLARDSSLVALWTTVLHYEGSPGLWQTVLHALIRLGFPYAGLGVISGILGLAAAWLVIRYAPFPGPVRFLLPFTFFLCYQYAVVARSYSLLPPLLFGCAALYHKAFERPGWATGLLCLMAGVSLHGLALSLAIWIGLHLRYAHAWRTLGGPTKRKLMVCDAAYVMAAALNVAIAWPAGDVMFVTRLNPDLVHLRAVSGNLFRQAFTGEWVPSIAVLALSVPFLWKGRALAIFAISSALLCAIAGLIYSQVWHQGLLLLAWLFALWVAAKNVRPTKAALAALAIVILFQCYWTVRSIGYDWNHAYSGSREAALFLKTAAIPRPRLYAIGYACTALQPYFRENIFGNLNGGAPRPAFWDWSSRNHVNEDSRKLDALQPAWVLVGYKGAYEQDLWTSDVKRSGYERVRHFEGNLYWRDRILEPESYDLYRRTRP